MNQLPNITPEYGAIMMTYFTGNSMISVGILTGKVHSQKKPPITLQAE
jgi:hypothetical protein